MPIVDSDALLTAGLIASAMALTFGIRAAVRGQLALEDARDIRLWVSPAWLWSGVVAVAWTLARAVLGGTTLAGLLAPVVLVPGMRFPLLALVACGVIGPIIVYLGMIVSALDYARVRAQSADVS